LVGMPVIVGAGVLKAVRSLRSGRRGGGRRELLLGAASAFCSTLLSATVMGRARRARGLVPYAVYRVALALVVARRLWREAR
ncbi:MAG: hypothetical protein KGJ43_05260, partial [Acidobacteriota bacterium]|nr:hypothetical protein [Acidobacteriota bacterium]